MDTGLYYLSHGLSAVLCGGIRYTCISTSLILIVLSFWIYTEVRRKNKLLGHKVVDFAKMLLVRWLTLITPVVSQLLSLHGSVEEHHTWIINLLHLPCCSHASLAPSALWPHCSLGKQGLPWSRQGRASQTGPSQGPRAGWGALGTEIWSHWDVSLWMGARIRPSEGSQGQTALRWSSSGERQMVKAWLKAAPRRSGVSPCRGSQQCSLAASSHSHQRDPEPYSLTGSRDALGALTEYQLLS